MQTPWVQSSPVRPTLERIDAAKGAGFMVLTDADFKALQVAHPDLVDPEGHGGERGVRLDGPAPLKVLGYCWGVVLCREVQP